MPVIDNAQILAAEQDVAVRQVVLAGPGTGKTQAVAMRIEYLIRKRIHPAQILVLSFSRSAVRTLMRRLSQFSRSSEDMLDDLRHVSIRTFDSWTFRLLRQLGYVPRDLLHGTHDKNIALLTELMQGDQRGEVLELLSGVRHVIVDEFQDLSGVRGLLVCALLELLAPVGKKGAGFTVLGDEAQAIYGFATRNDDGFEGITTAEMISRIRKSYAKELVVTELDTNHRSTPKLAKIALHLRNILVSKVSGEKKLDAMRKIMDRVPKLEGEIDLSTYRELEADTMAVLTRTNGEAIRVYQQLMGKDSTPPDIAVVMGAGSQARSVPSWIGAILGRFPGSRVTRSKFAQIYNYLFSNNDDADKPLDVPKEDKAWRLIAVASGLDETATYIEMRALRERMEWRDFLPDDLTVQTGGLHIMTIHQSKGMEFDAVSLLERDSKEPDDVDPREEASVIFVGITRAGKALHQIPRDQLNWPLSHHSYGDGNRKRWERWRNGWMNMEMGLQGDIATTSFVDRRVHGSTEAVEQLQRILAQDANSLHGRKVMLCKRKLPDTDRYVYGIHLQTDDDQPGLLLGTTSQQLTIDILGRIHGLGYKLPWKIFNLRVTDVVTMALRGDGAASLVEPWSKSGIWLGVNIYGTGDFKPYK